MLIATINYDWRRIITRPAINREHESILSSFCKAISSIMARRMTFVKLTESMEQSTRYMFSRGPGWFVPIFAIRIARSLICSPKATTTIIIKTVLSPSLLRIAALVRKSLHKVVKPSNSDSSEINDVNEKTSNLNCEHNRVSRLKINWQKWQADRLEFDHE